MIDDGEILPPDVRENAKKRWLIDRADNSSECGVPDHELLPYTDFADIAKVIESKLVPIQDNCRPWLVDVARKVVALAAARNRVCHTRPLEPEDLPSLVDLTDHLLLQSAPFPFNSVGAVRSRLASEPGFVFSLQIPAFWIDKPRVHHNLPLPEFDDTGFLGRKSDRQQVMKLLGSHYPVVTIVGEGGIGKTALALRCLYDVIDNSNSFDAVIWVSLKTSALTAAGVRQLNGAITSTLGILSEVAHHLGVSSGQSEADYIDEISEYLSLYRILIAIDNLETITVGPLRELLLRVPSTSKVLLTSRVGIGEFEARYPLQGLEEKAAIALTRAHAKVLGVAAIQKLDDGNIKGYCRRLIYNPLLIKWFVSSVARGGDPSILTSQQGGDFASAIYFCFQNLYERLGSNEREVVHCLVCSRRPLSYAELHFILPHLATSDLEVAVISLHNSNLVIRSKNGAESLEYAVSESASVFIARHDPPLPAFFKDIQAKLMDLRSIVNQESILEGRYEYDPYFVRTGGGRDERICATYLRRALDSLKMSNFQAARSYLEEARRLTPQSGEVWRISALVEEGDEQQFNAYEYYEQAIDVDPKSRISRYCFGMFHMNVMYDHASAIKQFDEALILHANNPTILTAKAQALTRSGGFEEATGIHEKLLEDLPGRERRWRLSGVDQAADSYKKWAHRLWELKEYSESTRRYVRAIEIIRSSVSVGDFDEKLLERAAKVVADAFAKRELCVDDDFLQKMVGDVEFIVGESGIGIQVAWFGKYALRNIEACDGVYGRLQALDKSYAAVKAIGKAIEELSESVCPVDGVRKGIVHNLQPSFGFIVESDGARWFFHRSALVSDLQWLVLAPGMLVEFNIGSNEKGACAVNVRVL